MTKNSRLVMTICLAFDCWGELEFMMRSVSVHIEHRHSA